MVNCFKAYDIRGRVPDELNDDTAYRIGRAYASFVMPKRVIVGRDMRLSSDALAASLSRGLTDAGVDVIDIGVCGTEEVYFSTYHARTDGGIMITASHNPADYNGMKLVREESRPISGDSGLNTIRNLVIENAFGVPLNRGAISRFDCRDAYIHHLLGYMDLSSLKPLKIVVNPGNGCAGLVIDRIEQHLPIEFVKVNYKPDGTFPNGIPNPLLPENRASTADAVRKHGADLGLAWDGDFDRCFLFDEQGEFIEGYYIVGLLAKAMITARPGAKIIHDPRLVWNTIDIVTKAGGIPVQSKTGHAFIKERMRAEDAAYGGEMSAHHYFKDFAYCDSGMIPWLLVVEILNTTGKPLSALVGERMRLFPASGEINRELADPNGAIKKIEDHYQSEVLQIDRTDGLSMEFADWRFNLRSSNTEPVVRLNVESRADETIMKEKTAEILSLLDDAS